MLTHGGSVPQSVYSREPRRASINRQRYRDAANLRATGGRRADVDLRRSGRQTGRNHEVHLLHAG